ncbi:two-component system response regulator AruR [Hydrogenophaga aquatica]
MPRNIALVDADAASSALLASALEAKRVQVTTYACAEDLLVDHAPFAFEQYIIECELPGIDGRQLLQMLRRRTQAGALMLTTDPEDTMFVGAMDAGADMLLLKPVNPVQVLAAVRAIHRRSTPPRDNDEHWLLDAENRRLLTPQQIAIDLSATDFAVMNCFVAAGGHPVSKADLNASIGRVPTDELDNGLHAIIYRLRKRIERASSSAVPLHTVPGAGYVFKGKLSSAGAQ